MFFQSIALATVALSTRAVAYKYVASFSVDGLHSSDVDKYVNQRPQSTIAKLLNTGYQYPDAFTSAPSDSFPGTLNQYTGASPRTTGVWYDDTYDRTFWLPFSTTGSNCAGPPGAEVTYDETKDYNSTELFSGGIDPANLPQSLVNGKCENITAHQRVRVNTVFEIVQAQGYQTAYADKHPAYDIVRGPSGKGLTIGYFPEIASIGPTVEDTIAYDQLHVNAFLDWINGTTPANSEVQGKGLTGVPTLFGGNFQAVSVAEKTSGYVNGTLAFTPELLKALDFVDASLGMVVSALTEKGLLKDTLIIVASKHGQAPINPALYNKVDPALIVPATGVNVSFVTTDDIALIFLANHADTNTAVKNLDAHRAELKIADLIYGQRLTALGFGNPLTDPAVPDIIVRVQLGTIYTTSTKKIAEHGGLSNDDAKVACFASSPGLKKTVFSSKVSTRQVAPTVLKALGLDVSLLQGAVVENTTVLPGF